MRRLGALVLGTVVSIGAAACGSGEGAEPSAAPSVAGGADPATPPPAAAGADDDPSSVLPLRFGAVTERSVDGGADGLNATAAVASMNEFAIDLYRAVAAEEGGNTVVSPYSVTFALGMIYAGARGETATEMAGVLHADALAPADWHEGINAYDLTLDARTAGSSTDWAAANKVWTQQGMTLQSDYLDVLTGAYGSPLAEVDFGASGAPRELINGWVADSTSGLIPELFPAGSLEANTRMVLVNAVALDAPWEFPFDPAATTDQAFTRADGTVVAVPMMRYDEYLPSMQTESVQAVELPYGDGALSMVVIVPTDLAAFESELTTASLGAVIDAIADGGIHLSLPRWTARTHVTLNDVLSALGMPSAFGGSADFSGMVDGGGLWLDHVEHEAVLEVDEQGTRAAAATSGEMAASHGPTIEVNRPFLYVIRDRGAGTILFIGRVTDPTISGP
jgi:serpin B